MKIIGYLFLFLGQFLIGRSRSPVLSEKGRKALPSFVERLIPVFTVPVLILIIAGGMSLSGFGPPTGRYWRGSALFGCTLVIVYFMSDPRRAIFSSLYFVFCLSFTWVAMLFILTIYMPLLEWWWVGVYKVEHVSLKLKIASLLSFVLSPFFTCYTLFAATDSDVSRSIDLKWIGDVFIKLFFKPFAVVITILSILLSSTQLAVRPSDSEIFRDVLNLTFQ